MAKEDVFVGRGAELKAFRRVLERADGEAVVVVGQMGMGKTWLVNRMGRMAEEHPNLKCGCVRYEVTPTDSVDSTMAIMMDNAFEAASTEAGSFDGTERRMKQWKALLNIIKIGDLVYSLKRDPARNTREQFLERLRLISKRTPENGRAMFIIDPEKYMEEKSDQSWAIVVKGLPEKIKLVFAQRPDDVFVESETFCALDNVVDIPEKGLDVLDEQAVDELLDRRAGGLDCSVTEIREALGRYQGHPYAIGAALDLLEAGIDLEELPDRAEPVRFAEAQWKKVCQSGEDAIKLFEAYGIAEVGVPEEVVEAVSGIDSATYKRLMADNYLAKLLRAEGFGKRIYHAILADYILGQIGEEEKQTYHVRAIREYKKRLSADVKPDALAAVRLAEHVLAAEGTEAFVETCAYETWIPLRILGLLDTAINLAMRALEVSENNSKEEAALRCTMGLAYAMKGDLDGAEEMHLRALEIESEGQREGGMAREYGNLGTIYRMKGELEKAEDMHVKSLELEKKRGHLEGIARGYGSLGLIYGNRGKLESAEEMYRKALEINEKIGGLEMMAIQYGNLGVVYQDRGELEKAKEMYLKALEIDERMGNLVGRAASYTNLGVIYKGRGDLKKARDYWEKARDLYKRMGMEHKVEEVEGWMEEIRD